jgi:hypothetical protein
MASSDASKKARLYAWQHAPVAAQETAAIAHRGLQLVPLHPNLIDCHSIDLFCFYMLQAAGILHVMSANNAGIDIDGDITSTPPAVLATVLEKTGPVDLQVSAAKLLVKRAHEQREHAPQLKLMSVTRANWGFAASWRFDAVPKQLQHAVLVQATAVFER